MSQICLSEGVRRYQALVIRIRERIRKENTQAVADYLGLRLNNYYAKRSGKKPFQYSDVSRLVERYGDEIDREDLQLYLLFRDGMFDWLKASPISMKSWIEIIGLTHLRLLTYRGEHPQTWEPEELARIGRFLDDFGRF